MDSFLKNELYAQDPTFFLTVDEYKASGEALLAVAIKLNSLGVQGGDVTAVEDAFCDIMMLDEALQAKYLTTYNPSMRGEVQERMEVIIEKTRALETELKSLLELVE